MSKNKSTWIGVAAVVVLAGALFTMTRSCSGSNTVRDEPFHGLMSVLAEETAALLGGPGEVVLIPEDREGLNAGFREALSRNSEIRLITADVPAAAIPGMTSLSMDGLQEIVDAHPGADAFVSLRGFPPVSPDELRTSSDKMPLWIVVYGTRAPWTADDHPFDLLIVPRSTREQPDEKARSTREWFERYYTLLEKR